MATRPVSPHVFEVDGKGFHYRMPINAVTSILNRATGTALTVGTPRTRLLMLQAFGPCISVLSVSALDDVIAEYNA